MAKAEVELYFAVKMQDDDAFWRDKKLTFPALSAQRGRSMAAVPSSACVEGDFSIGNATLNDRNKGQIGLQLLNECLFIKRNKKRIPSYDEI